jgi:hypothetical protein
VPAPEKTAGGVKASPVLETLLSVLNGRAATLTPGAVVGAGVYLQTGQIRQRSLMGATGSAFRSDSGPVAAGG